MGLEPTTTQFVTIFPDYTKSFKKTFNSKYRAKLKLKAKDTETRKTKTEKDENLVLPKEQVENADFYEPY